MEKTGHKWRSDQSGGVAVTVAIALTMLLGIGALALDLGHLYSVKSEMRKAAEAGAYAGARALGLPRTITDWNWENGRSTAVAAVQQNFADTIALTDFSSSSVQVGYWDMRWDPRTPHDLLPTTITPAVGQVAAVKVTLNKTSAGSGSSSPVAATFASIMGIDTMGLQASAVAEISPPTNIPYPDAFPFALPYTWVQNHYTDTTPFQVAANQHITSGGQWTSFKSTDNSASYIDALLMGTVTGESIGVGDNIYIQTGERGSIYNVAQTRVGDIRYIPVVMDGFADHAFTEVLAYVPFEITYVSGSGSNPYVEGHFKPGWVDPRASGAGGKYFGDPLPPKLIQ